MLLKRAVSILAVSALAGCGGGGDGAPAAPVPAAPVPAATSSMVVEGAVQKGPFIVGSTVLVNRLDNAGRPTSSTLVAEIKDSIGSFSFTTDQSGPVQIVATGYYFSELTGQISQGMLTLKALYDVSADARQTARVNILTHLINDRVLELIADGKTLREAIAQAEDELVAALSAALPIPDLNSFSKLSLYDSATAQNNTLGNAYLLALSTGFYQYAKTKAQQSGTATDAELTLALNLLSDDLADDGKLTPGPFIGEFVTDIRNLSPATIAANLRSRSLVDYPQGLGVPDISVFLSLCAGTAECAWSSGAPLPWPSNGHETAVHAGRIYLFGGVGAPLTLNGSDVVAAYDPVANAWTPKGRMPLEVSAHAVHTIGDTIYLIVAVNSVGSMIENKLYAYDPVHDQWSAKRARPTYRYGFTSAVVDRRLYVMGGRGEVGNGPGSVYTGHETKSHVEIYDPVTDSWSTGAPAPMAYAEGRACAAGDQIYVFGAGTDSGLVRSILVYTPSSNSWTARADMPTQRSSFACVTVDNAVYLVGGFGTGSRVDAVERYDPFLQTWTSPTRLNTPRTQLSAAAVGKRIFTIGGMVAGPLPAPDRRVDVVEILDTERL